MYIFSFFFSEIRIIQINVFWKQFGYREIGIIGALIKKCLVHQKVIKNFSKTACFLKNIYINLINFENEIILATNQLKIQHNLEMF